MLDLSYNPNDVINLTNIIERQKEKLRSLCEKVRKLQFVPLDPAGSYIPIAFRAFDGGMFNLHFDPFEFDIVEIADSNGNLKLKFASPSADLDNSKNIGPIIQDLNSHPIIQNFLKIMKKESLADISEILTNRGSLMEIGEFACIFDKVSNTSTDEKTLVLRDGLLRTKKIKAELIDLLLAKLADCKNYVKVVGVAKTSKIMFLLKTALLIENVFPSDQIGYVKIPLEIENMAYRWSGSGLLDANQVRPLDYAFGSLYIAKLSRTRSMMVTIEIPENLKSGNLIYSEQEIMEIIGYLAKDSMYSYPIIGYPQTMMRAHEFAVRLGLPASILKDNVMEVIIPQMNSRIAEYIRDSKMLGEEIEKGSLGGIL